MGSQKDLLWDLWDSIFFLFYAGITIFGIPYFALLAGGGAESQFFKEKYVFYAVLSFMVIAPILIKIIRAIIYQISRRKKNILIDSILHDPEESLLWEFKPYRVVFSKLHLTFLLSLVVFGGLAIVGGITQATGYPNTAFPQVEQQVTETAELSLAIYPASPAETFFLLFFLTFCITLFKLAERKGWLTRKQSLFIQIGALSVSGGVFWMLFHLFRYGNSEIALISTFLFGLISSLFTIVTRTALPALVYHDTNNGVQKAIQMFSSDMALLWMIVGYLLIVFLTVYLIVKEWDKDPGKAGGSL